MYAIKLTNNEIERIRRAAEYVRFPWRPICERPKTARRFLCRVEAEIGRGPQFPDPANGLRFAGA